MNTTVKLLFSRCCTLLLFMAPTCLVQGGSPTIESVWPPVGQKGTEFQLKIVGSGLSTSKQLVFYSPHVTCKSLEANSDYEVTATIVVNENCQIGNEPFRLLASYGFSEMRTLRITPFSVDVQEPVGISAADKPAARRGGRVSGSYGEHGKPASTNNDVAPTKLVGLNRTICGVLDSGSYDRYSLTLKTGQKISVEVEAVRLGSELLDTVVTIIGPGGEIIARADDNSLFQQDPFLAFEAARDGDYVIDIHESNYNGGERSYYLLHVGEFPLPSIAYPAGGQLGTTVHLQFLGDAIAEHRQSVVLPSSDEAIRNFQLIAKNGDHVAPSPTPFRLSKFANVLESEPNDAPDAKLPTVTCPIAFNGILQNDGDVDCYAFEAEEGHPLLIESFANRIGSAADTVISVLDSEFATIVTNDDWGSHDSRIDFHPSRSGRYYLRVTDKLDEGATNAIYRIELTALSSTVTAFLPRPNRLSQQSQTIVVPKGNRVLARMGVKRELVDSDVRLEFIDLPSGVKATSLTVPSDQFWMPVVLEASKTSQIGGQLASMEAFLGSGDAVAGGFEQIVDLVAESADQLFQSATVNRIPVAVSPTVPFTVDLETPRASLASNGTIDIRVIVNREDGFKGPVRVELPFLPPWIVAEPFIIVPADKSSAMYRLEARSEAAARVWPLVATARVDTVSSTEDTSQLDGRDVASQIVELRIGAVPIAGRFVNLAAEQGQTIQVRCNLNKVAELPINLTATIEGLPNRVSASPVKLSADAAEVDFTLVFEPDAPIGQFDRVQCRLTGELNGQAVSFVVAPNSRLQIAGSGRLFRSADGSVLSPLEALRQQRNDLETNSQKNSVK